MRRLIKNVKFRRIKQEIRIIGIDDCPFTPRGHGLVAIIGIVLRGGGCIEGAMGTKVKIDGFDATKKIAEMINSSPHYKQLRVIMLDGITFAGFNIVNITKLFVLTGVPVLAVTKEKPNMKNIRNALMKLEKCEKRLKMVESAGEILNIKIRETELHFQVAGVSKEDSKKIIRISCTQGNFPEPLRLSLIHI